MLRIVKIALPLLALAALSLIAALNQSLLLLILFPVLHFVVIRITPAFRHHESLWMFILVAVSSIPLNISILLWMIEHMDFLFDTFFVLVVFRAALCYTVLFSIEEVVMGLITRLLWKKQRKLVL